MIKKKMNKKGASLTIKQIIFFIIGLIVLAAILMVIFKPSLWEWVRNLPSYEYDDTDKEINYSEMSPDQLLKLGCTERVARIGGKDVKTPFNDMRELFMYEGLEKKKIEGVFVDVDDRYNYYIKIIKGKNIVIGEVKNEIVEIDKRMIENYYSDETTDKRLREVILLEDLKKLDGSHLLGTRLLCKTEEEIESPEEVPEKEKAIGASIYPVVRVYYTEGKEDLFSFRWNRNLGDDGKIQVLMNIRESELVVGVIEHASSNWLLDPDINNAFQDDMGVYDYEKKDVFEIMKSKNEDEMIEKISKASEKEKADIDFPQSGQEIVAMPSRGYSNKMSKEEIKYKLMQYYSEFYKEEIKEAIGNGRVFASEEMRIYFSKGNDDLVIVRWNFVKKKPEIIIRPNEEKILVDGEEKWIDNRGEVDSFLEEYNKKNNFYADDLLFVESFLIPKIPSYLSDVIKNALKEKDIYTIYGPTGAENQDLTVIDINGRMYGYNINPDELFKFEEETEVEKENEK